MNSRELRIGNYVSVENEFVEIVAIDTRAEQALEVRRPSKEVITIQPEKSVPIILETGLLVSSCGFDGMGRLFLGIDEHLYYLNFHEGYILLANKENEPVIHFWDVTQLHQLQNLYFAIKGKEIPISFCNRVAG